MHRRPVHLDARFLEAEPEAVGPTTRRRENHVDLDARAVGENGCHALAVLRDRVDGHTEVELHAQRFKRLLRLSLNALVVAGHHARRELDDVHDGAEVGVGIRELEPDHAAADDQDLGRDRGKRRRLVACPDSVERVVDVGQHERHGARREDDGVGLDGARVALRTDDLDLSWPRKPTLSDDHLDLEPFGLPFDLSDQLVDDRLLASSEGRRVDRRPRGLQPVLLGMKRVADDVCRAKDRLGGDAAPVQTRPAQSLALDQHDIGAESRRLECSRVAAGTATKHRDTHEILRECDRTD